MEQNRINSFPCNGPQSVILPMEKVMATVWTACPGDSADVPGDLSRDLTTSPQRGGKGEETRPGKEIHLPHFSVFPVNLSFHLLNYQTGTKARGEGKRRPAQCYTCSQSQGGRRTAKVSIHLGCASHGCLGSRHILMAQRRRQPEA